MAKQLSKILRRRFRGVVVRASLPKTVTVRVDRPFRHPRLERVIRRRRKFLVHDEEGLAHVGDEVLFEETRPLSRRKRFRVVEIVKKAEEAGGESKETDAEAV